MHDERYLAGYAFEIRGRLEAEKTAAAADAVAPGNGSLSCTGRNLSKASIGFTGPEPFLTSFLGEQIPFSGGTRTLFSILIQWKATLLSLTHQISCITQLSLMRA